MQLTYACVSMISSVLDKVLTFVIYFFILATSSLPLSSSLLKLPTVRESSSFISVRGSKWDMRGHAKKYGLKGGLPKNIGHKRGSPRKFHSSFTLTASFNANTIKPL